MAEFYDAVRADDVPDESASVVEVNGKEIALVHTGGEFYALQNECTHANYPMGEGDLVGENILECPGHGSTFNVQTGEVVSGPADEPLEIYDVEVVDGMVRVAVE
ncbi:MAG TPA: non-heme iron oxygenase ferredoxin subunit [Actinomycetota bacterium]|nr:non-heme iron oxygenase ferredoxin subunit [Actinomycetota bacterium]